MAHHTRRKNRWTSTPPLALQLVARPTHQHPQLGVRLDQLGALPISDVRCSCAKRFWDRF